MENEINSNPTIDTIVFSKISPKLITIKESIKKIVIL